MVYEKIGDWCYLMAECNCSTIFYMGELGLGSDQYCHIPHTGGFRLQPKYWYYYDYFPKCNRDVSRLVNITSKCYNKRLIIKRIKKNMCINDWMRFLVIYLFDLYDTDILDSILLVSLYFISMMIQILRDLT